MPTRFAFSRWNIQYLFVAFIVSALLFGAGCASDKEMGKPSKVNVELKMQPAPAAQTSPTNAAQNEKEIQLQKAAAQPTTPLEGAGWKSLYDGHSLAGWEVTDFAAHGAVSCESGLILVEMGDALSGVNYTNGGIPTMNYEVALDAMKISGSDFFCGLTFPVGDSWCSLILGGWGGGTVGISSIDGEDASENETSQVMSFETNRWYHVRARVTENKIQCWLDEKQIVDEKTEDKKITLRFGEIELSKPLGVATYQTTAAFREIKVRKLEDGK